MNNQYCSVQEAIEAIKQKRILIIQDHQDREDEGDLYIPGVYATASIINFMISHGKGLVCVPITKQRAQQFNLKLMVPERENKEYTKCSFTVSVDARDGIGSGISPFDRAKTIQILSDSHAKPDLLVKPGHVFPLIAAEGGLRKRKGHTEAAIELSDFAKLDPTGVICEVIGDDGTMLKGKNLEFFAKKHNLKIITIDSLIAYITHGN